MYRNKNISLGVIYGEIGIRRVDILIEEIEQTWCLLHPFYLSLLGSYLTTHECFCNPYMWTKVV